IAEPLYILKAQPIRRQVLVGLAIALVPLAFGLVWSGVRARQEREDEVRSEAKSLASASASYLSQYLDGLDSLASALVQNPNVRSLNPRECDLLFAEVLKEQPLLLDVALTAVDGVGRGSGRARASDPLHAPIPIPYVNAVVHSGRPIVSELTTASASRKPTVVTAYPVRDDSNAIVGVLGMGINLERLQTIFASTPLPAGSVITLTDHASRVLARSLEPERFIGTTITSTPRTLPHLPAPQVTIGMDGIRRAFGKA